MRVLSSLFLFACLGAVQAETPVRRQVIALVGGAGPDEHNEDIAHKLLELPLNHCGFVVHRHYIERGPPPDERLADAAAVLTYFDAATPGEDWLWPWLERVVPEHRLRVLHFGELGPLEEDLPRLQRWLRRFGLDYDAGYVAGVLRVTAELRAGDACRLEADPRGAPVHRGPISTADANRVWVATRDRAGGPPRAPVVTGPWGGLALDPWTLKIGGDDLDRAWHLDPFLFFAEALGARGVPAPHPSVLNGRRMWFCQVDGDGFESLSTIQPDEFSAKVMDEEIFAAYQLPFTVSVIVAGLTKDYAVAEPTRAMVLARSILARDNVEPASHGVLHTLEWQRTLDQSTETRHVMWYPRLAQYEYGPVAEVRDSIRFIDERLLDGRRCAVMLWTGEANPFEDALAAAGESGAWNLNGGVFRWDAWHDSVGFVSPWGRRVGAAFQVYAGAANENDFDGFFTTMPGAFAHIDETIARTGRGRILKPADLYMHFYSAERAERLRSVHKLIKRWALEEETAPVFASTYCAAVHAASETAKVFRVADGVWRLAEFGGCRTVRLDGEVREVDWEKSPGVLGARRIGESLYVHLAAPDAQLTLAADPPARPHVIEANCLLDDAVRDAASVAVTATAHNPRLIVFGGLRPGGTITLTVDDRTEDRVASRYGRLRIELPEPGTTRVTISVQ